MKILAIIPARLNSSRLPEKLLKDINGKSVIERVYKQVIQCPELNEVIIAVDDQIVFDHVERFGGKAIMTGLHHESGTDRCAEVALHLDDFTHVINIQGDEPFINPKDISSLAHLLNDPNIQIATLISSIVDLEDLTNPNVVKVIKDLHGKALYFSRAAIPYKRDIGTNNESVLNAVFRHIGIYGFQRNVLIEVSKLKPGSLEQIEKLEQLRWLENAYSIYTACVEKRSGFNSGIDTIEDLERARLYAELNAL